MRAIARIGFGAGALGLALMAGTALCSAQTSVTRQITSEPVETTVAQGPAGTVVTRRPLDPTPDPGAPAFVRGPIQYPPAAAGTVGQAVTQDTVVAPAPAVTTRRVTTRRVSTSRVHARTDRPTTTGQVSRTIVRTVTQPAADQTLVLTPAQRQTVYRTIVQRQVYPPPVVVAPPVVETEVVPPPPPVVGYPLRTIYPAGDDYADAGYRDGAYRDQGYGYREEAYRDDRYRYPYHWDGVALVPGARLPASIPLSAVPASVVANVPTLAPYSYAYVDDRVYLVDPGSGIIVAELTR